MANRLNSAGNAADTRLSSRKLSRCGPQRNLGGSSGSGAWTTFWDLMCQPAEGRAGPPAVCGPLRSDSLSLFNDTATQPILESRTVTGSSPAVTKSAALPGESEKAGPNGRHPDAPGEPARPVAPLERGVFRKYWAFRAMVATLLLGQELVKAGRAYRR
jgi:hypothetical protein